MHAVPLRAPSVACVPPQAMLLSDPNEKLDPMSLLFYMSRCGRTWLRPTRLHAAANCISVSSGLFIAGGGAGACTIAAVT
jgi:hypothetical protein